MASQNISDRQLITNVPVQDVERTRAFFEGLGFSFDPQMSQQGESACMQIGAGAAVMFLQSEVFAHHAKLPSVDLNAAKQAILCIRVVEKSDVDEISAGALAAGATEADPAEDLGFMYSRSFFDLDGHPWQLFWVNPAA